jgi:sugar O-acyltransferase (sialic acid O-acetyltransferase NeuD family)
MVVTVSSKAQQRKVVIACFGGFGRELAGWLRKYEPYTDFLGFIDDERPKECLGSIIDHRPIAGVSYLVANGLGSNRLKIAALLSGRGAKMGSLISPEAILGSDLNDDSQIILLGRASVSVNVSIGHQTLIQELAVIGHDVQLGNGCSVSSFSFIAGGCKLGREVIVNPHATLLPRLNIGDGATLGAGSVVIADVKSGVTVFGNPAKIL